MAHSTRPRRSATTREGRPCRQNPLLGSDPPLCHFHSGRHWPPPEDRRCTAQLPGGGRCPNWAARDENPALCATHSGRTGFPPGHQYTVTHGFYISRLRPKTTFPETHQRSLRRGPRQFPGKRQREQLLQDRFKKLLGKGP